MKKLLALGCMVMAPMAVALPVVLAPKIWMIFFAAILTLTVPTTFLVALNMVFFGTLGIASVILGALNPLSFTGNGTLDIFLTTL